MSINVHVRMPIGVHFGHLKAIMSIYFYILFLRSALTITLSGSQTAAVTGGVVTVVVVLIINSAVTVICF